jgi:hypothetical protein
VSIWNVVESKDSLMRSRTAVMVVGCALAAVTLAGCKSSTTSAAGSRPTQSPADQTTAPASQSTAPASQSTAPAASASGGGTAAAAGNPVAVCSLLPVATMAQLSGDPLTTSKEDDLPNAQSYTCAYTSSISTSNVAVTVLKMNAAVSYNAGVAAFGSEAKPISGVGDKAYSAATGLAALFGNVEITVSGLQNDDAAAVKIIQTLQPQL